MTTEYQQLFYYIDNIKDSYSESVQILDGLTFSHQDTLKRIEFYSNDKYLTGDKDALGQQKPFYNVSNYRVTVAKIATDIDVKDIRFEPDSLKFSVQAMLYNHELYKYLKDSNFSETLNEMGKTRPKYGGLLVKKHEYSEDDGDQLDIDVVDWKNVVVDPVSVIDNCIIEKHWMSAADFSKKADVWDNVEEVLKQYKRANKGKDSKIEICEVHGEFPESMYPGNENGSEYLYKRMMFIYAEVGSKKFLLTYEYEDESPYKYLPWERIPGRGLGRGIVEEGFEAQVWINDSMISIKNAMNLSGKVVLSTDSQKVSGNAITGIDNGHIFQLEPGRSITSVNLSATNLPEFQNIIELWNNQFDKSASTFAANTGEAPTAGTPYSQTALLNQVANSPFEYQREVWGIFLNEILNEWIKPFLKKQIMKPHYLLSEFDDEELAVIDNSVADFQVGNLLKERIMQGKGMTAEEYVTAKDSVKQALSSLGKKREIVIPRGYLDIEGNISANITGELKNKAAMLQSLDSIMKNIIATFNPNTGEYTALTDPTLSKIFGQIIELSGVPLSFGQFKSTLKSGQTADVSAVQQQAPVAA